MHPNIDNLAEDGNEHLGLDEELRALPFDVARITHGVRRGPDDANSATRPAGRVDCNQSTMAGFAAAHR